MGGEAILIVFLAIIASFLLVPSQIMLATSNRVDVRFSDFKGRFPYWLERRMMIAVIGAAATVIMIFVTDHQVIPAITLFIVVASQYLSDFYIIESIAKDL